MAADQAVITGLGLIFFGMAWISFKLNDSEDQLSNYLGVVFLALSIGVLQMIGFVALEIADAAGMTYVTNGVTGGLLWVLNSFLFLFWAGLLIRSLFYASAAAIKWAGKIFGKQV